MNEDVVGFVEGVSKGDVLGWVFNRAQPTRLEEVICHGPAGELPFHAFHNRQNILNAPGFSGRFGFAVPLHAVASLGAPLRFTTSGGQLLSNGVMTPPNDAARVTEDGPTHIFLHLQKTAGTAIAVGLQALMPKSAFASIYPGFLWLNMAQFRALHQHERQAVRVIFGHLFFGMGRLLAPRARYLTFVREPVARIVSHYWHLRRMVPDFQHEGRAVPHSMAANEALTDEFDNLQTRMIAGIAKETVPIGQMQESSVETALRNIDSFFDFVGFSETADADFARLCKLLKLEPGALPRTNEGGEIDQEDADFKRLDWERIRYNNRFDTELYNTLLQRRNAVGT